MRRDAYTATLERDGQWFISYCEAVPGANGQGMSLEECLTSLREAIALLLHRQPDEFEVVAPD